MTLRLSGAAALDVFDLKRTYGVQTAHDDRGEYQ